MDWHASGNGESTRILLEIGVGKCLHRVVVSIYRVGSWRRVPYEGHC
jgi:hypothetical protein